MKPDEKPSSASPRAGAERDAAQQTAGQPRKAGDEEHLQRPDDVPSRTDREMKKRDPAADRHANASFEGSKGEPTISDEQPPRGDRGRSPGGA
jgi:hypothetical protein